MMYFIVQLPLPFKLETFCSFGPKSNWLIMKNISTASTSTRCCLFILEKYINESIIYN